MKTIASWIPWIWRISPESDSGQATKPSGLFDRAAQPSRLPEYRLVKGEVMRLQDQSAAILLCLEGTLWVTDAGRRGDIILRAGDEMFLDSGSVTIVEALVDSALLME